MVDIKIEGQSIEVSTQQLDFSFKCPVFDSDNSSRAYSLPHKLPCTPELLTRLQNMNRIDSLSQAEQLSESIYINGIFFEDGFFNIEKASYLYFDGHFKNAQGDYLGQLEKVKLKELLSININIPQTATGYFSFFIDNNIPVGNYYAIVVNDIHFSYQRKTADTLVSIAYYFADQIQTRLGLNASVIAPQPTQLIIRSTGQSVRIRPWGSNMSGMTWNAQDYISISDARKLNFRQFLTTNIFRNDIVFPFMYNPSFYEKNNLWTGHINKLQQQNNVWTIAENTYSEDSGQFQYTYIPFVKISYILSKIADNIHLTGYTGDFDGFDEINQQLVLYNNYALDDEIKDWYFDIQQQLSVERYTNVLATSINLDNHIPDITAREFLQVFCDTFNLRWDIINRMIVFSKKEDLLQYVDDTIILENTTPFSIERAYKKRNGLKLSFSKDDDDKVLYNLDDEQKAYTEGDGSTEIILPSAILAEFISDGKRCCYAEQRGVSKASNGAFNKVPKFFFNRGIQPEQYDTSKKYLQSASQNKNVINVQNGNISLKPTLLFQQFWKETAKIRAYGFPITIMVNISFEDILNLKKFRTALYRINTEMGAAIIAIDTIDVSIDEVNIKEVKITALSKY